MNSHRESLKLLYIIIIPLLLEGFACSKRAATDPRAPAGATAASAASAAPVATASVSRAEKKTLHVCVDRTLPPELRPQARRKAETENPKNRLPPGATEIAALKHQAWQPGRVLHVRFLGADTEVERRVQAVASEWMNYANIHFVFDNAPNAEIRVAFLKDQGSWSYIGTDTLHIDSDKPTMNLGWLDPQTDDDEYHRVVLHEFGHTLGCVHEHQNPAAGIQWNKEVVYNYYAAPPNNWDRATVDNNLFKRYSVSETSFTQFDTQSIMIYAIPPEFTSDGFSVGWNVKLSDNDTCFVGRVLYPKSTVKPCLNVTLRRRPYWRPLLGRLPAASLGELVRQERGLAA